MARFPRNQHVENNQLQIQELVVRYSDTQLMASSVTSATVVLIGEVLNSITSVLVMDDDGDLETIPAASCSIVNSKDFGVAFGSPPGADGRGDGVKDSIKVISGTIGGGVAPILGDLALASASTFAILAGAAITDSVPSSNITGDLGESPGSTITPVIGSWIVSGSSHLGDGASLQAVTDATAAFNAGQTRGLAGTTLPSELGGTTVVPGDYQFIGGFAGLSLTSGNSTLTFNGPGTYLFYTASTLTTGASGSTDLPTFAFTGGATSDNTSILWIVGSSATINQAVASAGARFYGTVIAYTSITVTQQSVIVGHLFAGSGDSSGALTLSDTSTVGIPTSTNIPLTPLFDVGDALIVRYVVQN